MSAAKYTVTDTITKMSPPITRHALNRYHERLPEDAVRPPVAWRRGEDIQHPAVVSTFHSDPPSRVRVYNHDHEYFVIFIVDDKLGSPAVVSVYNSQTHEHGPTRAYLHSHGPHHLGGGQE